MAGKNYPTTRAGRRERSLNPSQNKGGRPPVYVEAMNLLNNTPFDEATDEKAREILNKLRRSNFRIPENPNEGVVDLVAFCRAKLMEIVMHPTRHAQAQVAILRGFLEEACGKVEDRVKSDQTLKVEIVKSATPAAAPPATAGEVATTPDVTLPILPTEVE